MKKIIFLFIIIFMSLFYFTTTNIKGASYLVDKMEETVNIDVSGVEALCQTDDGYVWIAQYSGLTRYDSKEFVSYKNFTENNTEYDIINVRKLVNKGNDLYILTYKNLFKYSNYTFSNINLDYGNIDEEADAVRLSELTIDKEKNLLYVCSSVGLVIYDINNSTSHLVEETKNRRINDVMIDSKRDKYYYISSDGLYNDSHELIYEDTTILDGYIHDDILYLGLAYQSSSEKIGGIICYDLSTNSLSDTQYDMIKDQVNTMIYSENDKMLFIGCEAVGIYCISLENGEYSLVDNLVNKVQFVDLMIDYENNLWVASHNTTSSGLSIITKNALSNLLFDDIVWQSDKYKNSNKTVYSTQIHEGILYICLGRTGLVLYDLNNNKILPDDGTNNVIVEKTTEYFINKGIDEDEIIHDFRDVEYFNGKLYFADYGLGLIEYNLITNNIKVYDIDFFSDSNNILSLVDEKENFNNSDLINIRCIKAFDDYLAIGYQSGGVYKFQNDKISVYHTDKSTLYIQSDNDGKTVFNHTAGIFRVNDDFSEITEIPVEKNVDGNILKFQIDGSRIYYNLNGRFFYSEYKNGEYINREIIIPYVKGSIVEISKIRVIDSGGIASYKYVIASQNQIYITSSLDSSNIDSFGRLIEYEIYDSTNGLKPIQANTSGYYDESEAKYYFQTTDGVFVYDFNEFKVESVPTKIDVNSVSLDGVDFFGNDIKMGKDVHRIEFNLSILGFKPNKGHTIYYKLDGVDDDYIAVSDDSTVISYTNLSGGSYKFHVYAVDSNGVISNQIDINVVKAKKAYEHVWFWILMVILALIIIGLINFIYISRRIKRGKERELELKGVTIESIEAIARTIDVKDTYTNGHSIRVGHYSRKIAEALGMEGDELENLYYIALLHDIGKIGIPDAILNKPGRLTDKEFETMKTHTTKGAKILKDISTIPNIVEGAKYHHEKYGGGGYPEGLKGEEIPYIARIICCADCFDAMATRRVYKEPYPKEKIISEFERCKETQFDPKIADVVIKLIKEGKLKAE